MRHVESDCLSYGKTETAAREVATPVLCPRQGNTLSTLRQVDKDSVEPGISPDYNDLVSRVVLDDPGTRALQNVNGFILRTRKVDQFLFEFHETRGQLS